MAHSRWSFVTIPLNSLRADDCCAQGVEHRPVSEAECSVMLVETAGLVITGDGEQTDRTTSGTWI